jgi:hypothetical protein
MQASGQVGSRLEILFLSSAFSLQWGVQIQDFTWKRDSLNIECSSLAQFLHLARFFFYLLHVSFLYFHISYCHIFVMALQAIKYYF